MTAVIRGIVLKVLLVFSTVSRICERDSARRSAVRILTRALGAGTSLTVTLGSCLPHGVTISGPLRSSSDVSGELPDFWWVVRDLNYK